VASKRSKEGAVKFGAKITGSCITSNGQRLDIAKGLRVKPKLNLFR
jgi:hypothetical protein